MSDWIPFRGYQLVKREPGPIMFPASVATGDILSLFLPPGSRAPVGWTRTRTGPDGDEYLRIAEATDAGRTIEL